MQLSTCMVLACKIALQNFWKQSTLGNLIPPPRVSACWLHDGTLYRKVTTRYVMRDLRCLKGLTSYTVREQSCVTAHLHVYRQHWRVVDRVIFNIPVRDVLLYQTCHAFSVGVERFTGASVYRDFSVHGTIRDSHNVRIAVHRNSIFLP